MSTFFEDTPERRKVLAEIQRIRRYLGNIPKSVALCDEELKRYSPDMQKAVALEHAHRSATLAYNEAFENSYARSGAPAYPTPELPEPKA